MASFPRGLMADMAPSPGRPLIDNNIAFYAAVGFILLAVLLLLLWLRRAGRKG